VPLRKDLVRFYTLQGRIPEAAEQYRQMRRFRRHDADIAAMLAYYLLRDGQVAEAERICAELVGASRPQVQAMINLGVIRFAQGKDAEARELWEKALRLDPNQPLARVNLARRGETELDRRIDLRFLAPIPSGQQTAAWTNNLAQAGQNLRPEDRLRLSAEATQLDPTYAKAHMRLAAFHLETTAPDAGELAAWHARRAVELVRELGPTSDLPLSLLVLAHVLIETGRPEEALPVLAEGKAKANATLVPQFLGLEEKIAGR
jgi:tetratricopeptide (TPR) repeat protein